MNQDFLNYVREISEGLKKQRKASEKDHNRDIRNRIISLLPKPHKKANGKTLNELARILLFPKTKIKYNLQRLRIQGYIRCYSQRRWRNRTKTKNTP